MINVSKYENVTPRAIAQIVKRSVPQPDGCVLWAGTVSRGGYGMSSYRGPASKKYMIYVHRAIYVATVGNIPIGLEVDHACHDPAVCIADDVTGCTHRRCVNIDHLRLVTPRANTLRSGAPSALNAAKTRCARGHEYGRRLDGSRKCQPCNTMAKRAQVASRRDDINAAKRRRAAEVRRTRMTEEQLAIEDAVARIRPALVGGVARQLRQDARLSQAQMGRLCGSSQSRIHIWETGAGRPTGWPGALYAQLIEQLMTGGRQPA